MEAILTKIYTQKQLETDYQDDDLFIDFELKAQFENDNPDAFIKSTVGESSDNGDDTFTYTLTIQYDI